MLTQCAHTHKTPVAKQSPEGIAAVKFVVTFPAGVMPTQLVNVCTMHMIPTCTQWGGWVSPVFGVWGQENHN